MESWRSRAAIGALKSMIPMKGTLRRIKRRISPYETNTKNDPGLLDQSLRQVGALAAHGFPVTGKVVVEIGTGWLPVLPLVYRMAGAERVITIDQERLADGHTLANAVRAIRRNLDRELGNTGVRRELFDTALLPDETGTLRSICEAAHLELRAPFDFNDMETGSADIVVSRTVLEHISEPNLARIFQNAGRILKPGGVMCHTIDMSDHYEHLDKTISRVNFLKYEPLSWRLTGLDPQLYQNRLRRFEYLAMLDRIGFDIRLATGEPSAAAAQSLKTMRICERYRSVPIDELAILETTIIATVRQPPSKSDR